MNLQHVVFPMVILAVVGIGGVLCRRREKHNWNNGICSKSGLPWVRFDCDSQGGRGYKDGDGNTIWISYNVDTDYQYPK